MWLLGPAFVLSSPEKKLWLFLRFLPALTPSSNPSALEDVKSQITSSCPSSCVAFHALFVRSAAPQHFEGRSFNAAHFDPTVRFPLLSNLYFKKKRNPNMRGIAYRSTYISLKIMTLLNWYFCSRLPAPCYLSLLGRTFQEFLCAHQSKLFLNNNVDLEILMQLRSQHQRSVLRDLQTKSLRLLTSLPTVPSPEA